jgi:type III secretory pathway component EscV
MFSQFLADPKAPILASGALLFIAMLGLVGILNFPVIPLFVVSASVLLFVGTSTYFIAGSEAAAIETVEAVPENTASGIDHRGDGISALLEMRERQDDAGSLNVLLLEVDGAMLGPYLGAAARTPQSAPISRNHEQFVSIVREAQERVFRERGIILPTIRPIIAKDLAPGCYRVLVREQLVRSGALRGGMVFAAANAGVLRLLGIRPSAAVRHPIDACAASWLDTRNPGIDSLRHLGIELQSASQFLVLECIGAAFEVVEELFGLDEAKSLLAIVEKRHEQLVKEVFEGDLLSFPEFADVLRRLVRERVSVRDLKLVLEGIAEFAALNTETERRQEWLAELHGFLRIVLSRGIVNDSLGPGDKLRTFVLSSEVEEEFRSAVSLWDHSRSKPPLDPSFEANLRNVATRIFTPVLERGAVPVVVLCSSDIRSAVHDFFWRQVGGSDCVRTLAYQELNGKSRPESIGVLSVST